MYTVVCDSACDLWKDQAQELGVKVLRFPFLLDGEEQEKPLEKPEDFDEYYTKLKNGAVPSTSLINEFVLEEFFEEILKKGSDIFFIHFSGAMTSTFNCMDSLVDRLLLKYPERKFLVVDTLGVTMQAGVLVYDACKKLKAGDSLEAVKEYLETMKQKVACYFVVNDLFFLKRGGRISTATAIGGTLLGIKPLLKQGEDGKLVKVGTVRGKSGAINALVQKMKENGEAVADYPIIIMHSMMEEEAKALKEAVVAIVGDDSNVWIQPVGPIIGTHCGPGTLALIFRAKCR